MIVKGRAFARRACSYQLSIDDREGSVVGTVFKWLLVATVARSIDRFDSFARIDSFLIVLVLVLDPSGLGKRSRWGPSLFLPVQPAFNQQRSKIENEDEDEDD